MKEIKSILRLYQEMKDSGQRCAIAQVVRVEESSYRREGARMLVFESGVFEGGISGGCLEGDALKRSQVAILKQEPSIVTYDTSREQEIGVGLGCNGIIDVLISPVSEKADILNQLERCVTGRKEHLIATITAVEGTAEGIRLGQGFYYHVASANLENNPGGALGTFLTETAAEMSASAKSGTRVFQAGEAALRVFFEYIPPRIHLALYGDNYDVYPLLDLAAVLDWEVSLVGNIQKLQKTKLRHVAHFFPKDGEARPDIDSRTAIVLMAHDYQTDIGNLQVALASPATYIGALGPRKRFDKMAAEFGAAGKALSSADMGRIYAPCGLEIGANTPEEIASSICSEILGVFGGKPGGMLRDKAGPIHERS